jgi:hypothetical protein
MMGELALAHREVKASGVGLAVTPVRAQEPCRITRARTEASRRTAVPPGSSPGRVRQARSTRLG